MNGLFNEMTYFNGVPEPIEDISSSISTTSAARTRPRSLCGRLGGSCGRQSPTTSCRLSEPIQNWLAGRILLASQKSLTVYDGMFSIPENACINVKNTSFSITADVVVPEPAGQWRTGRPRWPLRRLEVFTSRMAGRRITTIFWA